MKLKLVAFKLLGVLRCVVEMVFDMISTAKGCGSNCDVEKE